jgi:hypothetical protein
MPNAGEFCRANATLSAIIRRRRSTMPVELNSFIKEKDSDRILVRHCFYGRDEAEAEKFKRHHLESCEYFRAAEAEHRTIDVMLNIDALPEFDEEALEEFLEVEDDEEDESDEDEEDEEDESEEDE